LSAFESIEIVVSPSEFSYGKLLKRLRQAGITLVGLHAELGEILEYVDSTEGRALIKLADKHDLRLTFPVKATEFLLPRELFRKDREMFGADEAGRRTPDRQLCVSSPNALETVENFAAKLARRLPTQDERFHFWPDDKPWCRCEACRSLTDSDQSLIFANAVCSGVRSVFPLAKTAYRAHDRTLEPPLNVQPSPGVFLEFQPSNRSFETNIDDPTCPLNRHIADQLVGLMDLFVDRNGCVLEGWLDAARHSVWERPPVKLPFREDVIRADLEFYASLGLKNVASFGFWLDPQYEAMHGPAPFEEFVRLAQSVNLAADSYPRRLR